LGEFSRIVFSKAAIPNEIYRKCRKGDPIRHRHTNPDFGCTATRDFVRNYQTPVLISPRDVPRARGVQNPRGRRAQIRRQFLLRLAHIARLDYSYGP
jgi:hypothetical protein